MLTKAELDELESLMLADGGAYIEASELAPMIKAARAFVPMTAEEADAVLDEIEPVPIDDETIERMCQVAFHPNAQAILDWQKKMGAELRAWRVKCERLQAVIDGHDLCHNLHGQVDARAFADGCAQEQRKLYNCAPDADRVAALTAELATVRTEGSKLLTEIMNTAERRIKTLLKEQAALDQVIHELLEHIDRTCDPATEELNGCQVDGTYVPSQRFLAAVNKAIDVIEPDEAEN